MSVSAAALVPFSSTITFALWLTDETAMPSAILEKSALSEYADWIPMFFRMSSRPSIRCSSVNFGSWRVSISTLLASSRELMSFCFSSLLSLSKSSFMSPSSAVGRKTFMTTLSPSYGSVIPLISPLSMYVKCSP